MFRYNSALYAGGAAVMGAVVGNRRAQRDIEQDWRLSPYTPMLDPRYQTRYRNFRAAQYAAVLGLTTLAVVYVANRIRR